MRKATMLLLTLGALAVFLTAAEIAVRVLGHRPFRVTAPFYLSWTRPDPELGWSLRPGVAAPMGNGQMTVWATGARATRASEDSAASSVVALIGCSYTQGFDVADEVSWAWRLQARLPAYDVRNYGTGGYGSYQSLLLLRRHFAQATKPTSLVVYGLGSFHGVRDRASRAWLDALRPAGRLLYIIPPHADVNGRGFETWPLRAIEAWPVSEVSALAHLAQRVYVSRIGVVEDKPAAEIETQLAIFEQMRDLAQSNGSRFLVATLYAHPAYKQAVFLRLSQAGIRYADCSPPEMPFQHPDDYWSGRLAACVAEAIDGGP